MNHEQIAQIAYRLWQERGCPEGSAEIDWERAEALLRESEGPEIEIESARLEKNSTGHSVEGDDFTTRPDSNMLLAARPRRSRRRTAERGNQSSSGTEQTSQERLASGHCDSGT